MKIIERIRNNPAIAKGLLRGGIIFAVLTAIAIPTAIFINGRYEKSDIKEWWKGLETRKPRPWGLSPKYCVDQESLDKFRKSKPKWHTAILQQRKVFNKEFSEYHKEKEALGTYCKKYRDKEQRVRVRFRDAPEIFYDTSRGEEAFCQYQSIAPDQLKEDAVYGKLHPHMSKNGDRGAFFTIYLCTKKFEKTMTYHGTKLRENLQNIGIDGIVLHEMWHLIFHKHPIHAGGIISATPRVKKLGPGAIKILKKKILPEFHD